MICILSLGYVSGPSSSLSKIGRLLSVFVWSSFHTAFVLDPSSFSRMRSKHGWNAPVFHVGNAALHHLPLFYSLLYPSNVINIEHVFVSVLIFGMWLFIVSGGTMRPDEMYVPLKVVYWYFCYFSGIISMLAYKILVVN
jgi:hypothetical protein